MKGQQAPTSRPIVSGRQSARPAPSQTASMNRNRIVGQRTSAMITPLNTVRSALEGRSNSRVRSKEKESGGAIGGGSGSASDRRINDSGIAAINAPPR